MNAASDPSSWRRYESQKRCSSPRVRPRITPGGASARAVENCRSLVRKPNSITVRASRTRRAATAKPLAFMVVGTPVS